MKEKNDKQLFTIKRVVMLILLVLTIVFAFLNFKTVTIDFLIAKATIPLFYEIIAVLIIGFICGYLTKNKKSFFIQKYFGPN
ncbi:hypothetical protein BFR44_06495 [Brochothrix thermosphacta]|nr:hypothetical protein BFR44_06495 [Brochothrix thermosphacta]